jgi:hypothetical protein
MSNAFRRLKDFVDSMNEHLKNPTKDILPIWVGRKGKGKNRIPSYTGHKHMAYKRANTK